MPSYNQFFRRSQRVHPRPEAYHNLPGRALSLTHLLACQTFIPLVVYPADSGKALPIAWRGDRQVLHERIKQAESVC